MRADTIAIHAVGSCRNAGRARRIAPAVLAGALDVAAAALLVAAAPQPGRAECAAAAALHLAAAFAFVGGTTRHDARRWLCAASVLAVPCFGVAIAAAVLATQGAGSARLRGDLDLSAGWSRADPDRRRLEDLIPTCDALLCGDDERRRDALAALARRADAEGWALLRWAARGRDPDLALLAALALDDIGERAERRSPVRGSSLEVRRVAG